MTDNEIIKALEICANNGDCEECAINPHHGNYGYCTSLAIKAALDLIKRQQAEIKRLANVLDVTEALLQAVINNSLAREDMVQYIIAKALEGPKGHNGTEGEPGEGCLTAQWLAGVNAEIERLKESANPYRLHYENLKAEILREFADRAKEKVTYFEDECGKFVPWVDCRDIDNLVKEMEKECEPKD